MHDVLMREGLIRSLNVVTVDLAIQTGLANVAATAARFGLPRPEPYPSLALGTTEVTPLQVAAAYAAFVNGGKLIRPTVITGMTDSSGETAAQLTDSTQIIKPTTAYMITDMLSDVTKRGTARRAKASFKDVAIAGKTGTSRDGWFVGYTPNLVCAVWIGYDDDRQLGLTGAEAALPVWIDFIREAIALRPSLGGTSFQKPGGISTVRIDPETGYLAGPDCPTSEVVNVASQFAPMECYKHMRLEPGFLGEDTVAEVPLDDSETESATIAGSSPDTTTDAPNSSGSAQTGSDSEAMTAHSRSTEKEVNDFGQPILVNNPASPQTVARPRGPRLRAVGVERLGDSPEKSP
jgi:penicillin-binding protein 1B